MNDAEISEDYKHIKDRLSPVERTEIANIRNAILEVYRIVGLGYSDNVYYGLINAELGYRGIPCRFDQEISVFLDDVFLKEFKE